MAWAAGFKEPWGCQPRIVAAPGDPRFGNSAPEGDTVVGKALALTECPGRVPGQSRRGWKRGLPATLRPWASHCPGLGLLRSPLYRVWGRGHLQQSLPALSSGEPCTRGEGRKWRVLMGLPRAPPGTVLPFWLHWNPHPWRGNPSKRSSQCGGSPGVCVSQSGGNQAPRMDDR